MRLGSHLSTEMCLATGTAVCCQIKILMCHLAVTCYLTVTGTYSNLVKQAKSKQKILDKMEAAGLTPPVQHESTFHFQFPDCDKLPPPVLPFQDVSFAYSGQDKDCLYRVSYRNDNRESQYSCRDQERRVMPVTALWYHQNTLGYGVLPGKYLL